MSDDLRIRPATPGDARLLWELRNDPLVRANSFTAEFIPWDAHQRWFAEKLSSAETRIFILEDKKGAPLGQIRFDRQNRKSAQIHLSIVVAVRGRGYGQFLLTRTLPLAQAELDVVEFVALVKSENEPSLRLFRRAGFTIQDELILGRCLAVRLVCIWRPSRACCTNPLTLRD
jgi:RimJ/RimL family protein N-acetyltransferase